MYTTFKCVCGSDFPLGNTSHKKKCSSYLGHIDTIREKQNLIIELYNISNNINDVIDKLSLPEETKIGGHSSLAYITIKKLLIELGVYNAYSKKAKERKCEKMKSSTMENHGVDNISKLRNSFDHLNKRPIREFNFLGVKYKEYKDDVERITKKNKKLIVGGDFCYYTGIKFSDCYGNVNPNDPFKRTIDHKTSVTLCFINNVPPEKCADIDNLCYAARCVNSLKTAMDESSFLVYSQILRQAAIDEGFEHN